MQRVFHTFGNFSHGIAFISQNNSRLRTYYKSLFLSGHFEYIIELINADALDSQVAQGKPVYCFLKQCNDFQLCVLGKIAHGHSNGALDVSHDNVRFAQKCDQNTGVTFPENGLSYVCVLVMIKNQLSSFNSD